MRKIKTGPKSGINRINWNFRLASTNPIQLKESTTGRYSMKDDGPMALPGSYTIELHQATNGKLKLLNEPVPFKIEPLNNQSLLATSKATLLEFQNQIAELRRRVKGAGALLSETSSQLKYIKAAVQSYPSVPLELMPRIKSLENDLNQIEINLYGNNSKSKRDFETYPSISGRIGTIVYQLWHTTTSATNTQKEGYKIAIEEFEPLLVKLKTASAGITALEQELEKYGVPYIPGRGANWKAE